MRAGQEMMSKPCGWVRARGCEPVRSRRSSVKKTQSEKGWGQKRNKIKGGMTEINVRKTNSQTDKFAGIVIVQGIFLPVAMQ